MTRSVQELLDSFDHLAEVEQREAASEILRRVQRFTFDPPSDHELILTAEQLFEDLDHQEESNERR